MLKEEERAEEEFCAVLGPRPKPIMSELERETQKYHAAHSMASESNLTLHEAMRLHVKNLKLLSQSVDDLKINIPGVFFATKSVKMLSSHLGMKLFAYFSLKCFVWIL